MNLIFDLFFQFWMQIMYSYSNIYVFEKTEINKTKFALILLGLNNQSA